MHAKNSHLLTLICLLALTAGCTQENATKQHSSGMKCGAGKCGANMFDSSSALGKKKANILRQMRQDDPRKACVQQAATTSTLYDCVRDPKSGKLTKKCGSGKCGNQSISTPMKCGNSMKCGAGKCG